MKSNCKDDFQHIGNLDINSCELTNVEGFINAPYINGGVKRIHIGEPTLHVKNEGINSRIKRMIDAGYTSNEHFIEFNDQFEDIAKTLSDKYSLPYYHFCAIIVPAGQCMPTHPDTYAYLMKLMKRDNPNVEYDLATQGKRYMTFLTDWEQGQSFGAGSEIKWNWEIGDIFEWGFKYPHWCSNAGMQPMMFFEITGVNV